MVSRLTKSPVKDAVDDENIFFLSKIITVFSM